MLTQSTKPLIGLVSFMLITLFYSNHHQLFAQSAPDAQPAANAVYLPLVASGVTNSQPPTSTPTVTPTTPGNPTATLTPTATPTASPTATPTTAPITLPTAIVATWYSGDAPLNDFYNPDTGEWREVNGLGQMVEFAANGVYTYTGFLRLQVGACRSEVSTFKGGTAAIAGTALTLTPTHVRTRTVTICGSTNESITEGPYDPIIQRWEVNETEGGQEQLTIGTAAEAVTYHKAGMVASLAGVWQSADLGPTGFYDPATEQFDLDSPEGMWFDFNLDGTYRYGERNHGDVDDQGCVNQWWIYQTGTFSIVGGRLSITPAGGMLHQQNSCPPFDPTQGPWLDDARDYTWFYRDRDTAIKLVIIPLSPFIEFIFTRP